ncbi:hypothetical protein FFI97_031350 [Variovorax sp. KBS0712]|uniref:hypothetical protein n=1 Tax=Variovorax sp. KBS0712 TaxID=2578111 RepID=UPI0011196823|nr:hypothetical protein [Variovorax sp. KBS0712]TSD53252.1 hypothetical protein FFI97_031350 [Variovorax sp. KBS0712]
MQIFLDYIHEMYYYLLSMSDDDLDNFYINDESCRAKLFDAMKTDFNTYGPVSKQRVLEAIEFILSSGDVEQFWRAVVPHAVPLDDVEDKRGYLLSLYEYLAGRVPQPRDFGPDVQLVNAIGPDGIDVRL